MFTNFYLKDNDWFNKLNIASMFLNVILKVHLWLNSSEWLARAPRMLEIEWPSVRSRIDIAQKFKYDFEMKSKFQQKSISQLSLKARD